MPCNNLTLLESQTFNAAGTTYGSAFECDYEELLVYLEITAQGAYTDETLDVTVQAKNPDNKYFDIGSFDQIGDQTTAILTDGWYRIVLPVRWFGTKIRIKVVVAGTAVDYTLNITTMKSGATQVAAGAAANELWFTNTHATLPDNVVMMGV